MDRPQNTDLPFFAYGLFRPGQLAFFQVRDFVREVADPAQIAGELRLRDGLPILQPAGHGCVRGALLRFLPERTAEAYDRISEMEPDRHYCWREALVGGTPANVLVGQSPEKGSVSCEDAEWNGWNDPLFTTALDVVEETLNESQTFDWNLKPLFRLQMAYLLLWSSIEHYVSLRYHLGDDGVTKKVHRLAREAAFVTRSALQNAASIAKNILTTEVIVADRPEEKGAGGGMGGGMGGMGGMM